MITRDRFCRNQANLSLKHICARLVDTQENKLLFQRVPPLKVLFYYLFLVNHQYFFMLLHSLQYRRTHSVWGWFRKSIISEEMLSESIFCLKSCWWLLVSTKGCSVRKHQWHPLPLIPASWVFPIDCNKKSFIFPYRGVTRHGSIHWTKNSKGGARIIWWQ